MTEKDAVELGLKHVDLAARIVQFFLVVTVAVWGWIIASDVLAAPDNLVTRVIWALLFAFVIFTVRYAVLEQARRINACFALARSLADDDLAASSEFRAITTPYSPRVTKYGLVVMAIVIAAVLLFWPAA